MPLRSGKNPFKKPTNRKKPAGSGRQVGTGNKKDLQKEMQIVELLDTVVDWVTFYTKVYKRSLRGDMYAAKLLDERRWGKPRQSVAVSSPNMITFLDDLR